jgi:hypothetical protein
MKFIAMIGEWNGRRNTENRIQNGEEGVTGVAGVQELQDSRTTLFREQFEQRS